MRRLEWPENLPAFGRESVNWHMAVRIFQGVARLMFGYPQLALGHALPLEDSFVFSGA